MTDIQTLMQAGLEWGWLSPSSSVSSWSSSTGATSIIDDNSEVKGQRFFHPARELLLINTEKDIPLGESWIFCSPKSFDKHYRPIHSSYPRIDDLNEEVGLIATILAILNPDAQFAVLLCCYQSVDDTISLQSQSDVYGGAAVILLSAEDPTILSAGTFTASIPVHVQKGFVTHCAGPSETPLRCLPCLNLDDKIGFGETRASFGCYLYAPDGTAYGLGCGHLLQSSNLLPPFLITPSDHHNHHLHPVISPTIHCLQSELTYHQDGASKILDLQNQLQAVGFSSDHPRLKASESQLVHSKEQIQGTLQLLDSPDSLVIGQIVAAEMGYSNPDTKCFNQACQETSLAPSASAPTVSSPHMTPIPSSSSMPTIIYDWSLFKITARESAIGNPPKWKYPPPDVEENLEVEVRSRSGHISAKRVFYHDKNIHTHEWAIFPGVANPGDSGTIATMVDGHDRRPLGLVWGEAMGGYYTVMTPLTVLLKRIEEVTGTVYNFLLSAS